MVEPRGIEPLTSAMPLHLKGGEIPVFGEFSAENRVNISVGLVICYPTVTPVLYAPISVVQPAIGPPQKQKFA